MKAFYLENIASTLDTGDQSVLNVYLSQFLRYLVAGGCAFVVDFSILFLATESAGFHYLISAAFGFIAGLTVVYIFSIYWVFDSRKLDCWRTELFIFTIIGLVGLGFNEVFMWLQTDILGLHYLVSKIGTTATVMLWNFSARKLLLFS